MKAYRGPRQYPGPVHHGEVLTEHEMMTITLGFLTARAPEGVPRPELDKVMALAQDLKIQGALFDLLVRGSIRVRGVRKGELVFEAASQNGDTLADTGARISPQESANDAGGQEGSDG